MACECWNLYSLALGLGMLSLLVFAFSSLTLANFAGNELWFQAHSNGFDLKSVISTPASAAELAQTRLMTATTTGSKKLLKAVIANPAELTTQQLISGYTNIAGNFTVTVPTGYWSFVSMDPGTFNGLETESSCGAVWLVSAGTYTGSTSYGYQYKHVNASAYANVSQTTVVSESIKETDNKVQDIKDASGAIVEKLTCDLFDLR